MADKPLIGPDEVRELWAKSKERRQGFTFEAWLARIASESFRFSPEAEDEFDVHRVRSVHMAFTPASLAKYAAKTTVEAQHKVTEGTRTEVEPKTAKVPLEKPHQQEARFRENRDAIREEVYDAILQRTVPPTHYQDPATKRRHPIPHLQAVKGAIDLDAVPKDSANWLRSREGKEQAEQWVDKATELYYNKFAPKEQRRARVEGYRSSTWKHRIGFSEADQQLLSRMHRPSKHGISEDAYLRGLFMQSQAKIMRQAEIFSDKEQRLDMKARKHLHRTIEHDLGATYEDKSTGVRAFIKGDLYRKIETAVHHEVAMMERFGIPTPPPAKVKEIIHKTWQEQMRGAGAEPLVVHTGEWNQRPPARRGRLQISDFLHRHKLLNKDGTPKTVDDFVDRLHRESVQTAKNDVDNTVVAKHPISFLRGRLWSHLFRGDRAEEQILHQYPRSSKRPQPGIEGKTARGGTAFKRARMIYHAAVFRGMRQARVNFYQELGGNVYLRWTLSTRHIKLKMHDICDIYAMTASLRGTDHEPALAKMGITGSELNGVYLAQDYPEYPHPHCECVPVLVGIGRPEVKEEVKRGIATSVVRGLLGTGISGYLAEEIYDALSLEEQQKVLQLPAPAAAKRVAQEATDLISDKTRAKFPKHAITQITEKQASQIRGFSPSRAAHYDRRTDKLYLVPDRLRRLGLDPERELDRELAKFALLRSERSTELLRGLRAAYKSDMTKLPELIQQGVFTPEAETSALAYWGEAAALWKTNPAALPKSLKGIRTLLEQHEQELFDVKAMRKARTRRTKETMRETLERVPPPTDLRRVAHVDMKEALSKFTDELTPEVRQVFTNRRKYMDPKRKAKLVQMLKEQGVIEKVRQKMKVHNRAGDTVVANNYLDAWAYAQQHPESKVAKFLKARGLDKLPADIETAVREIGWLKEGDDFTPELRSGDITILRHERPLGIRAEQIRGIKTKGRRTPLPEMAYHKTEYVRRANQGDIFLPTKLSKLPKKKLLAQLVKQDWRLSKVEGTDDFVLTPMEERPNIEDLRLKRPLKGWRGYVEPSLKSGKGPLRGPYEQGKAIYLSARPKGHNIHVPAELAEDENFLRALRRRLTMFAERMGLPDNHEFTFMLEVNKGNQKWRYVSGGQPIHPTFTLKELRSRVDFGGTLLELRENLSKTPAPKARIEIRHTQKGVQPVLIRPKAPKSAAQLERDDPDAVGIHWIRDASGQAGPARWADKRRKHRVINPVREEVTQDVYEGLPASEQGGSEMVERDVVIKGTPTKRKVRVYYKIVPEMTIKFEPAISHVDRVTRGGWVEHKQSGTSTIRFTSTARPDLNFNDEILYLTVTYEDLQAQLGTQGTIKTVNVLHATAEPAVLNDAAMASPTGRPVTLAFNKNALVKAGVRLRRTTPLSVQEYQMLQVPEEYISVGYTTPDILPVQALTAESRKLIDELLT